MADTNKIQNEWNEIGSYIQEKLDLPKFPHRIECFDISHIQGTNTVAVWWFLSTVKARSLNTEDLKSEQ